MERMKGLCHGCYSWLLALIFCWTGPLLQAQDDIRPAQPLVVTGDMLTAHFGAPVEELFLFRFRAGDWQEVAFQIDEVSGNSFFETDDGLLDGDDELVFQPQDGGEQVLIANWIEDVDARNHVRIALAVTDPLSAESSLFYLYRSATLVPAAAVDYVQYDQVADEIFSSAYRAGFDDILLLWDELRPASAARGSIDILDREKLRISGRILAIPYSFSEEDFTALSLEVKDGPVRVIRQVLRRLVVIGNEIDIPDVRFYYQSFFNTPAGDFSVDPSLGVEQVRISMDHSAAASGATFDDPNNSGIPVDGVPDGGVITALSGSQLNGYWTSVTGPDWRLLSVGRFIGLGSETSLYYHDQLDGSTGDGTDDSGDLLSYGDRGLVFDAPAGGLGLASWGFVTGADGLTGPQVREFFINPLTVETAGQLLAEGLGELYELWHQPDPGGDGLITVLPIIDLIDLLSG